jgi:hypothetical protein
VTNRDLQGSPPSVVEVEVTESTLPRQEEDADVGVEVGMAV